MKNKLFKWQKRGLFIVFITWFIVRIYYGEGLGNGRQPNLNHILVEIVSFAIIVAVLWLLFKCVNLIYLKKTQNKTASQNKSIDREIINISTDSTGKTREETIEIISSKWWQKRISFNKLTKFITKNKLKIIIAIIIICIVGIILGYWNHKRIYNINKNECIKACTLWYNKYWHFDDRNFENRNECLDYCIIIRNENR